MIISVSQQKGGVGKTATSVLLSHYFSYVKGYKVLVIDLDAQGNATSSYMEKEHLSLSNVIIDHEPFTNVMKTTPLHNIDVIVSDIEMETLETHLIISPDGAYFLKDLIADHGLRQQYDIILIDTPPHLGRLTLGALIASDFVLIPLESKKFAADGVANLLATIAEVQSKERLNPKLQIMGAFINKYEERTLISKAIITSLRQQIPDILLQTAIRYNIRIEECLSQQELIYTYDPRSNAAADITSLGDEILAVAAIKGHLLPEPMLS